MTEKILIANRGEIALRIVRACQQMGLKTVVVHSTADRNSLPVKMADESVCIGPPSASLSYLNVPQLLEAAAITQATHIHPGYGFLAEQSHFAKSVEEAGLIFIGPSHQHIALMGDKGEARRYAIEAGMPCVPGTSPVSVEDDLAAIIEKAQDIGLPVLIKATGGGGGKGMRVVYDLTELRSEIRSVQHEAQKFFGDSHVYLEKYLDHPRHIEVQVLGDGKGHAIHIGMRDCSLQRRYQKIVEEAQPLNIEESIRNKILMDSIRLCEVLQYKGLGTLEFLYQDGHYYFIEMNTRIQVEHPVSEMISQIDLVQAQLNVALDNTWHWKQEDILFSGHSIECRINAEDPATYMPCAGKIKRLHAPGGFGVRFDSHIYTGYEVPPFYDSMIAKIITHAPTREQAVLKMRQALEECLIEGLTTNLPLHKKIFSDPDFITGSYDTSYLKNHIFF